MNPVVYLQDQGITDVFRFVLTHPDMDHMDGLEALCTAFPPMNFWDSNNEKEMDFIQGSPYGGSDWLYYKSIRDGKANGPKRLVLYADASGQYYNKDDSGNHGGDGLHILAPTPTLIGGAKTGTKSPMMLSGYRLGVVLVTASAVAWSTAGFFTRLIQLGSWTMLAWRGLFGALGIAVVILALERQRTWLSFRNMGRPSWMFAAISAIGIIFFITSLRHTTVAHVAVICATVPFIAAALGWYVMRERPSASAVVASLAALLGVALMVGFVIEGGLFGDLLALGMTISMVVMMVIASHFRTIAVMPAASLSALLSGLVCWPFGEPLVISQYELLLLVLFGVVNSAVGLALFTVGAKLLPAIETGLIGSLDAPLVASVLESVVFF